MSARPPTFEDVNIAALAPDHDAMLGHLRRLFGEQTEGLVELAWTPRNSNQVTSANLFGLDRLEDLVARAAELNAREGHNVYIGATLRHPDTAPFGRTNDGDVLTSVAYWADLDDPGCAEAAEARCGAALPTFAVTTGQHPHLRQQLYWLQEDPVDLARLKSQNDAIAAQLQSDSAVINPGRVMRLAGSIAWPKKEGRIAEMTELITYDDRPAAYVNGAVAAAFPIGKRSSHDHNYNNAGGSDLNSGPILEGHRNQTLTRICGHLLKALSVQKAREELRWINKERCDPSLPDDEVDRIVDSIAGLETRQQGKTKDPTDTPEEPDDILAEQIEPAPPFRWRP